MGDDIATYRIRIGLHCTKSRSITKPTKFDAAPLATYFFGIITAALLIIAGTEVNPGPTTMEQLVSAVNSLRQEVSSLKNDQFSNFKNLDHKITQIATDFNQLNTKQTQIIKTQERHENILRNYDARERLNNLVFYGIPERKGERSWDMSYEISNFLAQILAINISEESINNLYRLGKGVNRPLLVKFNSKSTRDYILDNRKKLKGSQYRIDEDFNYDTREARRKLLPFMHDARSKGHKASLRQNKLMINGKIFDLDFCTANFNPQYHDKQQQRRNRSVSPPTRTLTSTTYYQNSQIRTGRSSSLEPQPNLRSTTRSPETIKFVKSPEIFNPRQNEKTKINPEIHAQPNNQEEPVPQPSPRQSNLASTSRYEHHQQSCQSPRKERATTPEAETVPPSQHQDQQLSQGKIYTHNKDCDIYKSDRINHNYSLRTHLKTFPNQEHQRIYN